MDFLHDLRQDRKNEDCNTKQGISPQTFNFYLQAIKLQNTSPAATVVPLRFYCKVQ